jgi:hypothetical protein
MIDRKVSIFSKLIEIYQAIIALGILVFVGITLFYGVIAIHDIPYGIAEHFHHVVIMRKILLRMSSWMNYLFPFH